MGQVWEPVHGRSVPSPPGSPSLEAPRWLQSSNRSGQEHRGREYRSRGDGLGRFTGRGVAVLLLTATTIAGFLGIGISGHRNALFGVTFTVVAALGAVMVRRRDLAVSVIAPPIVYCIALVVVGLVDAGHLAGGFRTRELVYLADGFITGAPAMWVATGLAALIALLRRLTTPNGLHARSR